MKVEVAALGLETPSLTVAGRKVTLNLNNLSISSYDKFKGELKRTAPQALPKRKKWDTVCWDNTQMRSSFFFFFKLDFSSYLLKIGRLKSRKRQRELLVCARQFKNKKIKK